MKRFVVPVFLLVVLFPSNLLTIARA